MTETTGTPSLTDLYGPVLHSYNRAEAIADGVLVDVSETAREAGIVFPVALTRAAWDDLVKWDARPGVHQDEAGRLWDVLSMTRFAIVGANRRGERDDRVSVTLSRVPNDKPRHTRAATTTVFAHCGPGDEAEPVITIMLDGES